ncbi:hypothetical protein [Wolbachia endosymbiont (group A) of Rhinocyllus conicus]|uniref:hypothetical protein n=1 Tax=Wolbachia endosymbiont (group A) of Rhinocyllus conicus TaxID=2954053 RepID=UPI002225FF34|nr:hypothetical protein [Wolbachia endosymbiont (group A) of Rhinocyllus conicus]
MQCLRLKKTPIQKIDNDQGLFCLFFRLVNFLMFIAKRQPSSRYVLAGSMLRDTAAV